jgi:hypothetical protein
MACFASGDPNPDRATDASEPAVGGNISAAQVETIPEIRPIENPRGSSAKA